MGCLVAAVASAAYLVADREVGGAVFGGFEGDEGAVSVEPFSVRGAVSVVGDFDGDSG